MFLQFIEEYKGWNIYGSGGPNMLTALVVFPAHLIDDPDNCPASGQWDTVESIREAIDCGSLKFPE